MNTKFKSAPEFIADLRTVDPEGNETLLGDKVTSIQIQQDDRNPNGLAQIDIRDFKKGTNLVIEIELPELSAALSMATLNANRNSK